MSALLRAAREALVERSKTRPGTMVWCRACQATHDFDLEICPVAIEREDAARRRRVAARDAEVLCARIQSRRSVSEADFPAWWAAHWKVQGYGVVDEFPPDSIPGALDAARARMGALTGARG